MPLKKTDQLAPWDFGRRDVGAHVMYRVVIDMATIKDVGRFQLAIGRAAL